MLSQLVNSLILTQSSNVNLPNSISRLADAVAVVAVEEEEDVNPLDSPLPLETSPEVPPALQSPVKLATSTMSLNSRPAAVVVVVAVVEDASPPVSLLPSATLPVLLPALPWLVKLATSMTSLKSRPAAVVVVVEEEDEGPVVSLPL